MKTTTEYVKCAAYLQGRLERIAIPQLSSRKLAENPSRRQQSTTTKDRSWNGRYYVDLIPGVDP